MSPSVRETLFGELVKLYGVSESTPTDSKIRSVLSSFNRALIQDGLSIPDIIPEGLQTSRSWRKGLAHEIFSDEYFTKFACLLSCIREKLGLSNLNVLEVGAGSGVFSQNLGKKTQKNISIIATDIEPTGSNVQEFGYKEAIEQFQPHIVIACWPLIIANVDGESLFLRTLIDNPTVKGCFLIGVPSRCGFDEFWFDEYQEESGSTFTNIMDIPELSRLQIGLLRDGGGISIKNGVNPLLLRDQGIGSSDPVFLGNTYTTSRTAYISRGNPKW